MLQRALEERENQIKNFYSAVQDTLSRRGSKIHHKLRTEDVVREPQIPDFKFDFASIMSLLKPKRKLGPHRKEVDA